MYFTTCYGKLFLQLLKVLRVLQSTEKTPTFLHDHGLSNWLFQVAGENFKIRIDFRRFQLCFHRFTLIIAA